MGSPVSANQIKTELDFERGTLVPLLTEYNAPPFPVQFVFPHSRLLSPRVRQFLDAVAGPLQERLRALHDKTM